MVTGFSSTATAALASFFWPLYDTGVFCLPGPGSFKNCKMANSLITYLKEAREELKKVVWPTRQETIRNTLLVIAISLGVAIFLGIIDFLLNLLLEKVIS